MSKSSPRRTAHKRKHASYFLHILCFVPGCSFFLLLWTFPGPVPFKNSTSFSPALRDQRSLITNHAVTSSIENNTFNLRQYPLTAENSLTAILPVNLDSLPFLEETLLPFLKSSTHVREVLIVCPEAIISQTRTSVKKTISSNMNYPDLSLRTLPHGLDYPLGVIHAASQVSTDWVLLMDHQGLLQENNLTTYVLLHPPNISIPIGPRGVPIATKNISRTASLDTSTKASYLYPPLVMPSFLIAEKLQPSILGIWAYLGQLISGSRSDGLGGIIIGHGGLNMDWSPNVPHSSPAISDVINHGLGGRNVSDGQPDPCLSNQISLPSKYDKGVFAIFLPTIHQLKIFSLLACMLRDSGHRISIFVYGELDDAVNSSRWEDQMYTLGQCILPYNMLSGLSSHSKSQQKYFLALEQLNALKERPEVMLYPSDEDIFTSIFMKNEALSGVTLIRIPLEDLPYCEWMGSLSIAEWRNWNKPRIDISIITKDRPKSLTRLLSSLSEGRYFGDSVNLRIHLEQSSDFDTLKIVENFSWTRGSTLVHHRVIHGGLLPAVVESWYPSSNDTYGLLLEDDVELSPLFYAWAKMSLLRYRYGDNDNRSPRMFGISLYQQKNVELPADGRRAFNARSLFKKSGIFNPSTPYLSPIPCSWGAIYFPEHWREFHGYLSVRLSESFMKINQIIVPNVRSNNWTKSWKKYFIELVYLRGYVMLYPNYEGFTSLSTNHLEVGSHVKVRTKEKQDSFILPLMQLPMVPSTFSGLLELPSNTLPNWNSLPVLNLTGSLTSLQTLADIGRLRRTQLTGCIHEAAQHDVWDLMCLSRNSP